MNDIVDDTLKGWRRSAFIYGTSDCLLSIGDYAASRGVVNIADRFRGTYADKAGALAIIAAQGGIDALINLSGLPPIKPARAGRGDIVILDTGTGDDDACVAALCTGPGIAARLERGVIEIDRRFVIVTHAWGVA